MSTWAAATRSTGGRRWACTAHRTPRLFSLRWCAPPTPTRVGCRRRSLVRSDRCARNGRGRALCACALARAPARGVLCSFHALHISQPPQSPFRPRSLHISSKSLSAANTTPLLASSSRPHVAQVASAPARCVLLALHIRILATLNGAFDCAPL